MIRTCLYAGFCALALGASGVAAAEVLAGPDALKWQPAPPALKGAEMAVVAGNPMKSGPFVVRLKLPANYKVPAHHHMRAENITVLSGDFHFGVGNTPDTAKASTLQAGGFVEAPAKMNHFAWTEGGAVLQIHGQGPFGLVLVDAAGKAGKPAAK